MLKFACGKVGFQTDGGDVPAGGGGASGIMDQTVEFQAAGALRKMTVAEAVKYAQLGLGATHKFEEAADIRKEAEAKLAEATQKLAEANEALSLKQDVDALAAGDEAALKRMAARLGIPADVVSSMTSAARPDSGDGGELAGQYLSGGVTEIPMAALPKPVRQFFEDCASRGLNPADALNKVYGFSETLVMNQGKSVTKQALESDPILGKMVRDKDFGPQYVESVWARVKAIAESGKQPLPKAIESVFSKEKELLAAFDRANPVPSRHVGPGALGGAPVAAFSGSRLEIPKEPDPKAYKGRLADFLKDKVAWDLYQAQQQT